MQISKIEKNIKIPKRGSNPDRLRSPLSKTIFNLKEKESFTLDFNTFVPPYSSIYNAAYRLGVKISIRKVSDKQVRIWRI